MGAMMVVIDLESCELSLQVDRIPEEEMVKVFTTNGSDSSFNERMRDRCIRYGLNCVYTHNPQVSAPLVMLVGHAENTFTSFIPSPHLPLLQDRRVQEIKRTL
jgi:hypothetical protein